MAEFLREKGKLSGDRDPSTRGGNPNAAHRPSGTPPACCGATKNTVRHTRANSAERVFRRSHRPTSRRYPPGHLWTHPLT